MDVVDALTSKEHSPISCIEMHTTGEPTRIVYAGYPELHGSLLEQRAEAKAQNDHIRRRLLYEPRGHFDMYGAVLRQRTELTERGDAHMGVLFLTNDGYSTMCGHATIALGRLLLDTHDETVFPKRRLVTHDPDTNTALLKLHAPCGLLEVTVPTTTDGQMSDPTRPVTFLSVPSFCTGMNVAVDVSAEDTWQELNGRRKVVVDFAYGGAFFCIVDATELGFPDGLQNIDHVRMNEAAKKLMSCIKGSHDLQEYFRHPDHDDLSFLYSIMIVDKTLGRPSHSGSGAETGLCYFADQGVDRSPTGSGVAARMALAYAKGHLDVGESWTYHSLVSNAWSGQGGFTGTVVRLVGSFTASNLLLPIIQASVAGSASYTGVSTYIVEPHDPLRDNGFLFQRLAAAENGV